MGRASPSNPLRLVIQRSPFAGMTWESTGMTKTQRRTSILLIEGDKAGDDRFYEVYVPIADDLYDEHLKEPKEEGLIE